MSVRLGRPGTVLPILLVGMFICVVTIAAPGDGRKGSEPSAPGRGELNQSARNAIARGLAAIAARQQKNGSWRSIIGHKLNESYVEDDRNDHVGITSLCCLAFMANGSLPGRGRYGRNVARGLDFVLKHVGDDGFIHYSGTRMYSHAFATLFLAEIYGESGREDLREKLERACRMIVKCQSGKHGGWRYMPDDLDVDLSVTVCQVQALRAARNNGIAVPKETIDRAIRYIKSSQVIDPRRFHESGGFKYQPMSDRDIYNRITPALTGAGLTALFGAGVYEGREIDLGVAYLEHPRNRPRPSRPLPYDYFYGNYYIGQAMFQVGGDSWLVWYQRMRDELVEYQRRDGTWLDRVGPVYATAMACLILQMPYRYLPIMQR